MCRPGSIPACIAFVLLAALATATRGAPPPSEEIAKREAELKGLREEISQLSAQLEDVEVRASGLQGALEKVALERRIQERRVTEAATEQHLAEAKADDARRRLDESEQQLADERAQLTLRMTGLYRIARHGHARLVFAMDPVADPLPAIRLLRYLARRDARSVQRFAELRAKAADEHRELDKRRAEAAAWYAQQATRRDDLVRLEQRQTALLAGVRKREKQLAERALVLADRETHLAALLDTLYGRGGTPLSGRPMQEFRGLLDWPVHALVSTPFGPRLDPRYGTQVPHNGVDLKTRPGDEVAAVYPGRVVFAASFEGYGPTVVVQHAGKVFSLYAGMISIAVQRGQLVSLRQPLGRAASTLYFEIRVENHPEDPRRWIR